VNRLLPWLLVAVATVWSLSTRDVAAAGLVQIAYVALVVTLPGALILQVCVPGRFGLVELLGLGTSFGLAWEVIGWVVLSWLGAADLMFLWSLLTLAALIGYAGTRRRLFSAAAPRLPVLWHWGVAAAAAIAVVGKYVHGVMLAVPGQGKGYAVDMLYHLAIVEEAVLRGVPLQNPQVSGELLRYHWFADAHLAASTAATGADPREVLFRTWLAPMILAFAVAVAALARQVVRTWWAGVAGAAAAVVGTSGLGLFRGGSSVDVDAFFVYSPSQEFAAVTGVGLVSVMLGLLVQRWPLPAAVLLTLALIGNAGAKPTMLPLAAAGCVGLLAAAVWRRDRRSLVAGLSALAAVALVWGLAYLSVTGSNTGSSLRPLDWFRQQAETPETLFAATASALVSLSLLLISWATLFRGARDEEGLRFWLAAATLAGLTAFVMLDHPGNSEIYFLLGIVPLVALGALLPVRDGLRQVPRRRRRQVAIGATVAGATAAAAVRALVEATTIGAPALEPSGFWLPAAAGATALAVGCLAWFALRDRASLRGAGLAAMVLAVLGGSLVTGPARDLFGGTSRVLATNRLYKFTPDEQAGANWIRGNTSPDDIVATPTYCLPRREACDARGFLITAMGARRTLLEGWAYTVESMAAAGEAGGFVGLPTPWPDRKALTDEAMTRPTAATMSRLAAAGVDLIFTDESVSTPAKTALDHLATPVFVSGPVRIYELRSLT